MAGCRRPASKGIILWEATSRQTWAATAYLRMILLGLAGMRFDTEGVGFQPCVPSGISFVEIQNLKYRNMDLTVTIHGSGTNVKECTINGQAAEVPWLSVSDAGRQHVVISLSSH